MTSPRHLTDLALLHPGDAGYDDELAGFQTGFAQRPDLVVPARVPTRGPTDVTAAVRYAAERRLPLGIKATGHGLPGPVDGGVLVSTRRMDRVSVDPETRTVRVQAGVR